MAVSTSTPRISVKDHWGPANSAHASTASKRASEGSRSRAIGNVKRRLVFTAEKGPDHGRKRVEGTPPRTRHRNDQDDKASKLARMADEVEKAMEVLFETKTGYSRTDASDGRVKRRSV